MESKQWKKQWKQSGLVGVEKQGRNFVCSYKKGKQSGSKQWKQSSGDGGSGADSGSQQGVAAADT